MQPITLVEIMAGDWRLVVEKDGDEYAASVLRVYGDIADYVTIEKNSADGVIDAACAFIESRGAHEDASALRDLAKAEVQKNIKRIEETT